MKKIKNIITFAILAIAFLFAFASCSLPGLTLGLTPDGCAKVSQGDYSYISCPDGRQAVEYAQPQLDGSVVTARATFKKGGGYTLSYLQNGVFVEYNPSAKNPIYIGPPPVTSPPTTTVPVVAIVPVDDVN